MNIDKIDRWHQTKKGLITYGLVELAVAYLLTSKAIDSGSSIIYVLALVAFIGGVKNLYNLFDKRVVKS